MQHQPSYSRRWFGCSWWKAVILLGCVCALLLFPMLRSVLYRQSIITDQIILPVEEIQRMRRQMVETACKDEHLYHTYYRKSDEHERLIVDDKRKIIFCIIAKAGSSYWRKFFHPSNPRVDNMTYLNQFPLPQRQYRLENYLKAMFVRHPLERLWSVYNDKIVGLVPKFLKSLGMSVIKQRKNATLQSLRCAHDVSFEEFLKYVINIITKEAKADEHWRPYYQLCTPCIIKYDIIGKLATFDQDLELFLSSLEPQNSTVAKRPNNRNLTESMLNAMCRMSFILYPPLHQDCLQPDLVLSAKWRAWQNQGAIPADVTKPRVPGYLMGNSTQEKAWKKFCIDIMQEWSKDAGNYVDLVRKRKRDMYTRAFSQLSTKVQQEFLREFMFDMMLYDYKV